MTIVINIMALIVLEQQFKEFIKVVTAVMAEYTPTPKTISMMDEYLEGLLVVIDANHRKIPLSEYFKEYEKTGRFGVGNMVLISMRNNIYFESDRDIYKYFGVTMETFNSLFESHGIQIKKSIPFKFSIVHAASLKPISVNFMFQLSFLSDTSIREIKGIEMTDKSSNAIFLLLNRINNLYLSFVSKIGMLHPHWQRRISSVSLNVNNLFISLRNLTERHFISTLRPLTPGTIIIGKQSVTPIPEKNPIPKKSTAADSAPADLSAKTETIATTDSMKKTDIRYVSPPCKQKMQASDDNTLPTKVSDPVPRKTE